jgi:hypothetical protein
MSCVSAGFAGPLKIFRSFIGSLGRRRGGCGDRGLDGHLTFWAARFNPSAASPLLP